MPLGRNVLRGNRQAVFDQARDVELSRFTDVLHTFIDSFTLRVASGQRGAENMVATLLLLLEDNGESVRHHSPLALSILTDSAATRTVRFTKGQSDSMKRVRPADLRAECVGCMLAVLRRPYGISSGKEHS